MGVKSHSILLYTVTAILPFVISKFPAVNVSVVALTSCFFDHRCPTVAKRNEQNSKLKSSMRLVLVDQIPIAFKGQL